jgi:DNA polymerase-3 subunit alpha
VFKHLQEKYGYDRVLHVGTYSRLGIKSAIKDLTRVYGIGTFEQNNRMSSLIPADIDNWPDAVEWFKKNRTDMYDYYLKHKDVFDLIPHFMNKIRQVGKHAGGVVITDKPIYEYAPVDRVQGELVTAYEESAQRQILDEIGLIKLDLLGIVVLDVIKNTIDLIKEKLFLVEDDDGIVKVMTESQIKESDGYK